jgi:hypothetical protein
VSSIRTRLLVGTGIGMALAFAIAGLVIHALSRSQLYDQFDRRLAERAQSLSALVEQDGTAIEHDLARDPSADYYELWAGDRVLYRSHALRTADLDRPRELYSSVPLPDGEAGRQLVYEFVVLRGDGTR